jgi:hypothetical protein
MDDIFLHKFLLPRGIRNNNPGNIRLGASRWEGQKQQQFDNAFVEFDTPVMGLRALMVLLLTYQRKYGLDTVESIINRYAPPHENATDHYIHDVARSLNVKRRDVLDLSRPVLLAGLARAIANHENGRPRDGRDEWFDTDTYAQAARLALHQSP